MKPKPSDKVETSIFPKDCCLCDVCNKQLTDGKFIALEKCTWYRGWLYCKECKAKYNPVQLEVIQEIAKGDDLSKTELAEPMVFQSW